MDDARFPRVHVAGADGRLGVAVAAELATTGRLVARMASANAVIDCPPDEPAGRLTRRRLAAYGRARSERSAALGEAALAAGTRLVHVGSAFAWGDHGVRWIDEASPQHPAPLGAGDAAEARRLLALHAERGLDVVVVCVGFLYGPFGPFVGPAAHRVVGWGGNYVSCVHVDDAARAVAAAVERGASGATYLAVDDEPLTQRALADAVADAAGAPHPPSAPVRLAGARVGYPLARSLASSLRVRNARAKAELGWAPRFSSVRDGVRRTVGVPTHVRSD